MRKYCTRCGAPLIKTEEPEAPEPIEEPEEEPVAETTGFSEARRVLPSEVASEQAKIGSERPLDRPPPKEDVASESQDMQYDKGREVVRDILEKVKAAEARSRGGEAAMSSEPEVEPPPEAHFEDEEEAEEIEEEEEYEEEEEIEEEEEEGEEEVEEVYEEEEEEEVEEEVTPFSQPEPPPPKEMPISEPAPVTRPSVSMAVAEPAKDEKIRSLEADIKTYNIELGQFKTELDKLRARLNEEVERYLVVAETKRTRTESLERELKLAKNEYNDANKEHKNAENRRKKELSNAEKRIRDVEKRINKAEGDKEKRIRELEKERLKREEEAKR